jgi:hypothetical protein
MKSIQILLSTFLLVSVVFSQNEENSGPYKIPKYFNQPHDTYIQEDAIILNYSPYVAVTNPSLIKFGLYQYAPLKSSGEFIEKKIPVNQGIVKDCYYSGDTITEFVMYFKKGFPKYQYSYAVRRRSCKTMELIGEEKKLTDYQYHFVEDHQYAHLLSNGNEFAFVEMTKTSGSVTFLAEDFEEISKVELTEQALSFVHSTQFYFPKINADGSIFLIFPGLSSSNPIIPLTETKNSIFHITPENEVHSFTTRFTDSDIYQMSNLSGNYAFDSKKQEISWSYATASKASLKESGFGIARWDLNGTLLSNQHTLLDFEAIFENEPEIQDWFKSKKISPEEVWGRTGGFGSFSSLKSDDGSRYHIIKPYSRMNPDLGLATFIIKTDQTGNIQWVKPFIISNGTPDVYIGSPYLEKGIMHVLVGGQDVKNKGITFSDISLDPKNGKEQNNYEVNVKLEPGEELSSIFSNKNKISLEIKKGKTVSYKTVPLK